MRRAVLLAAAASGLLACTELDALHGSPPSLPWSAVAPRLIMSPGASDPHSSVVRLAGGALELATDLPRAIADCELDLRSCADQDRDGLVDEWEDLVLDRFRPFVRIDDGDPLRGDRAARVGSIGRVAPVVDPTGRPGVRVFLVLGYSRDYGRCTLGDHLGDSERVALDLLPGPGGAVRVIGAYTAAHEGTANDAGRRFQGELGDQLEYADDPVTGEPRWAVYASSSKHATYASPALCEAEGSWIFCGDEDCAAGRSIDPANELLMPVVNAGEPDAPLAGDMMGEPAWEDVDFCGGLGHLDGDCASPLREKLLYDPFLDPA